MSMPSLTKLTRQDGEDSHVCGVAGLASIHVTDGRHAEFVLIAPTATLLESGFAKLGVTPDPDKHVPVIVQPAQEGGGHE